MNNGVTLQQHAASVVRPGESFLVALSGGADSVALASVLTELGHPCRAVHCNYHLRGDESDRDERHARFIAECLSIPIDVIQCDVERYRGNTPGRSVEMACRELRYEAFERLRREHGLDSIAVGHHLEDNIETMMLNLLRGAGVKGLAAMRPRRGVYVRPLLGCTKALILEYLKSKSLGYVTDSSNLSNDYRRNALRNDILPAIARYFPDATAGMTRTLEALASQRSILSGYIGTLREKYVAPDGTIDLALLTSRENEAGAILFELLNTPDFNGYNSDVVADIMTRANRSGLTFCGTGGTGYRLDHGKLVPLALTAYDDTETVVDPDSPEPIPGMTATVISPGEFKPRRDPSTAYFDLDKLRSYRRLVVRRPRPGDRMQPWGMNGSRLLSDIFTDLHATRRERMATPVLDGDGTVLWLAGIRASRHAAVDKSTQRILQLKYNPRACDPEEELITRDEHDI